MTTPDTPSIETGLPITKSTACRVGSHVFQWTSSGPPYEAPKFLRCDCGLTRYEDAYDDGA